MQTTSALDAGDHSLQLEVTLQDYPEVASLVIQIPVTIAACQIDGLADPDNVSVPPVIQVFELPMSESFDMPLFEPLPLCGYSNTDVLY